MPDVSASTARRPLRHLILCREYPPAPYPAGGIGTYARHIARLLAEAGETVHVVTQRWDGAPEPVTRSLDGRLTVHRISLDEPIWPDSDGANEREILRGLAGSTCPSQVFSWQAARYAERLVEDEAIDVIEAQEWEAPAYYLQVRRMLGLGSGSVVKREPPCIVHLHSPTQMIFEHNEWDTTLVDYLPLSRFEEFSIRAADALLCPSHYLARGVTQLFGLPNATVTIVRYPMGETPVIERSAEAWERDAICYVGRLELRKGVVEWVDAAVQVAAANKTVSFDFFGSDTPVDGGVGESVLTYLKRRIPRALRGRFRFHGSQTRDQLLRSLATFSIAVVPSRWENLPFTCIEAMATGLPVLVSPNGGMAELIRDGESGWVARDGSALSLAEALRHALATPPAERKAMGARAAETVQRMCANDVVVSEHLKHRHGVVARGAGVARVVPDRTTQPGRNAMGVVLIGPNAASLASVRAQTQAVVEQVVDLERGGPAEAARRGVQELLAQHPQLLSLAILAPGMRLAADFAATCESVLAAQAGVGIVSPWVMRGADLEPGPWPAIAPPGWQSDLPFGCAIRVEALQAPETEAWSALTWPEVLVWTGRAPRSGRRRYSGMALIQNPSAAFALNWFLALPLREKARWMARIILNPARIGLLVWWQVRRSFGVRKNRGRSKP
jgi:glycogen(starch) synthase